MDAQRGPLAAAQGAAFDLVSQLLRAGPVTRAAVVHWASEAVLLNTGAEASRTDPLKTASDSFLLNLSALLVKLAMPVVSDPAKFDKVVDAEAFLRNQRVRAGVFPKGTTPLVAAPEGAPEAPEISVGAGAAALAELKSFSTQVFFLAWRALHLGPIQTAARHTRLHREISFYQRQAGGPPGDPAVEQARGHFDQLLAIKFATEVSLLDENAVTDALAFLLAAARWCTRAIGQSSGALLDSSEHDAPLDLKLLPPTALLYLLPEHLVEDVLDLVDFSTQYNPRLLSRGGLSFEPLMTFVVYLLAHPSLVRSPHLRAKFGDVLFNAFLPESERFEDGRGRGRGGAVDDPHTALLYSHPLAQKHLAPSLLLLYGDVEHTGFYDKLTHRYNIALVLKYLWRSPDHRSTFQRISQDTQQFVRFANGLMNETNSLVTNVMEKLLEIRTIQVQQQDGATWGALPEERRNEIEERLTAAERDVKANLGLCNETLNMVSYLTSDAQIRKPFLLPELLGRLASMLLSVLGQLVGKKGLEIKVDNPESYNFRPKDMLASVMAVVAHFADAGADFDRAVATCGFYQAQLLPKAAATVRKLGLLDMVSLAAVDKLCGSVAAAAADANAMDEELGDVPEEFLDPLMCTIMQDPVGLPTSGQIVDRATIMQHLLNDETDPFNRKPLSVDMLQPQVELKARIDAYLAKAALRSR
eukprot:TRINITY_DN3451_c0_g1_i4.p1 TRINITY_DN3451_c0_g1~~TRINITY_DN3451_c0_g1_i4.p1  ORF type:complete len:754 (+),score=251.32 TRINITY_DN3451_c0_g1_i4:167-2263(+)